MASNYQWPQIVLGMFGVSQISEANIQLSSSSSTSSKMSHAGLCSSLSLASSATLGPSDGVSFLLNTFFGCGGGGGGGGSSTFGGSGIVRAHKLGWLSTSMVSS